MLRSVIGILIMLCLIPHIIKAQEDYYYTYSSLNVGSRLDNGRQSKNAMICQVIAGRGKIITYTPYEVKEYGFKDGRVYQARDILTQDSTKRVFLERLVKGKMTLYFYKGLNYKAFYMEKDSGQLIPLTKGREVDKESDYRQVLAKFTGDCAAVQKQLNLIIYNQNSLSSFVAAYNTCKVTEFPYIKYGIMFGYVNTSLQIPPNVGPAFLKGSSINPDASLTVSLFLDSPLGKQGLSFHPEIQYLRNNFDYYSYNLNQFWMVINTSCITLPLMLRYTVPLSPGKVRPYVNAGLQVSFLLKNEAYAMEDIMDGEVIISENYYGAKLLASQYAGYIAGAGLQFHIHHRINLFAEVRYAKAYAFLEPTFLDKGEFSILTGINF